MNKKIHKISIGIRYTRTFKLQSISGDIMDFCLDKFARLGFEKINGSDQSFVLISTSEGIVNNSLSVSIDNIVLSKAVSSINDDEIKKDFATLKEVFSEFSIRNIDRIGIVFEYEVSDYKVFQNGLLHESNFNTIEIRTSKNIDDRRNIHDLKTNDQNYDKVIFSYIKDEKEYVSFDYQSHYSPVYSKISDINFEDLLKKSKLYIDNDIKSWQKEN